MRHLSLTNTLLLQGIFRKLRVHLSSNNAPNRTIKVFWSSKSSNTKILLRRVAALLREKGYEIGNVDCTIRMQRPKLRPHIDAMRTAMAGAMGVGDDQVSVKATTTEHLGFEGREEGVSVSAVALIYKMQAKPGEETVG